MKEKLEKVKEALELANELCNSAPSRYVADCTAHGVKEGLALLNSLIAELDSHELEGKVADAIREADKSVCYPHCEDRSPCVHCLFADTMAKAAINTIKE